MNTNYGTGNNEGKESARETKERSPAEGEKPSRRRMNLAGNEVIKESKAQLPSERINKEEKEKNRKETEGEKPSGRREAQLSIDLLQ